MICGIIANQGEADCAFLLDASDAEIYAAIGGDLGNARLVPDVNEQGGTFTVDATWHSEYMAPAGISTNSSITFSNATGKKVIEFPCSILTPTGNTTTVGAWLYSYTDSAQILDWYIEALTDGTFSVYVTSGGGAVNHYSVTGLGTAPAQLALWMDATTGTLQVYLDDVAVTMLDDTLPTYADCYPVLYAKQASGVTSAGQEIYIGMTTKAAFMTGSYPAGTTDICGTPT